MSLSATRFFVGMQMTVKRHDKNGTNGKTAGSWGLKAASPHLIPTTTNLQCLPIPVSLRSLTWPGGVLICASELS